MSGWDGDAPAGHPWLILGPIARQILDRPRGCRRDRDPASFWDDRYRSTPARDLSWFQAVATPSIELIAELDVDPLSGVIDVGGARRPGRRTGRLRFTDLTVLDVSGAAGDGTATTGLGAGELGGRRRHHVAVRNAHGDLWHDRAVFHFMTDPEQRAGYLRSLDAAVAPGATIVVATFAPDGPERCSGLVVDRYDAEGLVAVDRADPARLLMARRQTHTTPWCHPGVHVGSPTTELRPAQARIMIAGGWKGCPEAFCPVT